MSLSRLVSRGSPVRLGRRLVGVHQQRLATGLPGSSSGNFLIVRHLSSERERVHSTVLDIIKYAALAPVQYIPQTQTISEAMHMMMKKKCGSLVVKDANERIVGFLTQRDLLRCISASAGDPSGMLFDAAKEPHGWNRSVREIMTKSKELVFLSPADTLEDARALMAVSGKRHIPVLSGSTLLGVLSPKDIARSLHLQRPEVRNQTAKTSYVSTVIPHKGIPLRCLSPLAPQHMTERPSPTQTWTGP